MTTIAALQLRQKYIATAAKRRPRASAVPVVPPPNGAVIDYTRLLKSTSDAMDAEIHDALRSERVLRTDAVEPLPVLPSQLARFVAEMTQRLAAFASRKSLVGAIDALAARVNTYSREGWRKQLQQTLGIQLSHDPDLSPLIDRFRRENLALIRSLAADKVERIGAVLQATRGERVEQIARAVRDELGVTRSRAAFIARDQVLKLNGQMVQARQTAAGITRYVWRGSRDARERPDHLALEGQVFAYASPPITDRRTGARNNPGQDFGCRCCAEPLLPALEV